MNAILAALAFAQAAAAVQAPEPTPTRKPLVVQIGVDLVRIDAVVTDGRTRHVTDLKAEDFEVWQDGKPQTVTYCEYIVADPASSTPPTAEPRQPQAAEDRPPISPAPLRPEDVRRAMAIVVDDLSLSFDGITVVREGVKKFVADQMRPGDLLAIVRTRGNSGVLQQFTNDKRVLKAAADNLLYFPFGHGAGLFDPSNRTILDGDGAEIEGEARGDYEYRHMINSVQGNAALNAVFTVIEALRALPGRKSVMLFSERLYLLDQDESVNPQILETLGRVTDLANRASVVIYTVDPRGVPTVNTLGAENTGTATPDSGAEFGRGLTNETYTRGGTQTGLDLLARHTGGLFFPNENKVDAAVRDVMQDQKGYYLIGYEPGPETFKAGESRPAFRRLKVGVKRAGLTVRSRAGFLSLSDDDEARAASRNASRSLLGAMVSPFAAQDLALQFTSVFGHDPRHGSVVRSFLHVDGAGLTFREAGGRHETKLQLAAAAVGDNGVVLQQVAREVTFSVAGVDLEGTRRSGLVLELNVPVPKAGAYQFRIAVRDIASQRLGSASQFVYVPDLKKKRLALSGVVLGTLRRAGVQADEELAIGTQDDFDDSPAVRRFRPGTEVSYGFAVYHPGVDRSTGKSPIETRLRVFRDGRPLPTAALGATQAMQTLATEPSKDKQGKKLSVVPGVVVGGRFTIPPLAPGHYALQMLVTDPLAGGKGRSMAQWTAFEIVGEPRSAAVER